MAEAISQARQTGNPQLVVAKLLRLCGHGEHDDAGYIDPTLKRSSLGRDCLRVSEEVLVARGWADNALQEQWRNEAQQQIDGALSIVQREPAPDPYQEKWIALATDRLVEAQS
jgi:acetoin:2,6-dichlorophenolindophenol oxidoreductase subunit alpha